MWQQYMYYVYLIKSLKKKWIYIGTTVKPNKRLAEHNTGKVKSTKAYAPFTLIYLEAYQNKTLARKRELVLKNNSQQKEILFKRVGLI